MKAVEHPAYHVSLALALSFDFLAFKLNLSSSSVAKNKLAIASGFIPSPAMGSECKELPDKQSWSFDSLASRRLCLPPRNLGIRVFPGVTFGELRVISYVRDINL